MAANILDPITINNVTLPNRVVYTAHGTFLSIDSFSEAHIAYMTARARGGCGLAIVECTSVHPTSVNTLNNFDDGVIPGFKAMMASIRPHGMRMFQQLYHGGHNAFQPGKRPPLAPSASPGTELKGVPVPLYEDQIETIINAFADSAWRCREGGLDGVEIHAAHGYLVHQFLNPAVNRREDRWGGSLENRMRFLQEVLRAVRRRVGRDYVVGVRLSGSNATGGVTEAELNQVVKALLDEDLIDYLNASYGDYYDMTKMVGTMAEPTGYMLRSSTQMTKAVTSIPRLVAGRFRTLEEAQQVLNEGLADMVGMVRAQIADPDLVRKTKAGQSEQVRPCIACNQGCVGGLFRDVWLGCTVNAAVGFEKYLDEAVITAAPRPLKVLVVGGGPAGMEAARVAALQGHRVVLVEAGAQLGGAVNAAMRAPGLHTIGDIVDWQERQIFRLGVEVRLGTYMDEEEVLAEGADRIVIATGSYPRMDGVQATRPLDLVPGTDLPHVISSIDLLLGANRDLGTSAVVLDDTGHYEAIAVADHLMSRGLSITWVTRFQSFAPHMQFNYRGETALTRFYNSGQDFSLLVNHHLAEIRPGESIVHPVHAPARRRPVRADTVVLVTPNASLHGLYDALRGVHPDVQVVGDALAPRDLQFAIADGHRAMRPSAPVIGDRRAATAA
jgi:2,4-dienoyl-CoA reductase-like NADH-dependent reductase (Old Yellow Enzyme family)